MNKTRNIIKMAVAGGLALTAGDFLVSGTQGRRLLPRRPGSLSDMATTNRRLVLALDQFTSTALPFYLELIARYTAKIQRVGAC